MNKEDLKNFKHLLSTGISTGMDIMLDYKFQKELLKKIKYYEKIEQENQKLKDRIDKAIEYMEENSCDTWNSDNTKLLYRLANVDNTIEILIGEKNE